MWLWSDSSSHNAKILQTKRKEKSQRWCCFSLQWQLAVTVTDQHLVASSLVVSIWGGNKEILNAVVLADRLCANFSCVSVTSTVKCGVFNQFEKKMSAISAFENNDGMQNKDFSPLPSQEYLKCGSQAEKMNCYRNKVCFIWLFGPHHRTVCSLCLLSLWPPVSAWQTFGTFPCPLSHLCFWCVVLLQIFLWNIV